MEFLTDIFGMVLSGGATGLFGTLISLGAGYLKQRAEQVEKAAERAHELALLDLQMKKGDKETENELAIIQAQAEGAGFQMAYRHDMSIKAPGWVDAIRSLMRPGLTLLLLGLTVWIWLSMQHGSMDRVLVLVKTAEGGTDLYGFIVLSIVYLNTTAIAFWFGDRAVAKHLRGKVA